MVRGEVEMKMVEGGEVEIFVDEVEKIFVVEENGRKEKKIIWENMWLWRNEGNKENRKKKRNEMRRYFLDLQK